MRNILSAQLVLALTLWGGQCLAAGDLEAGKTKAATCVACHGADGNGVDAIPTQPRLAGQHAEYTAKQLHDFKSGKRENAIMAPFVAGLSDQDIIDISAYYASLKGTIGSTSPELVELGETLYRAGSVDKELAACMSCHGPRGLGNPAAKYPSIKGQFAEYSEAQLMAFKSEARANDLNQVMRHIAAKMTNEEIRAIASYMEGLH